MYVRKTYIAEDGKEFKYEGECRAYEAMLLNNQYASMLTPFIALFDKGGHPISYAQNQDTCYIYVKQIPDWEDEKFMDIWDRLIPSHLTVKIDEYGCGWYYQNDNYEWHSWSYKMKMHEKMQNALNKMYEQIS